MRQPPQPASAAPDESRVADAPEPGPRAQGAVEASLSGFLDTLPDAIVIVDSQGRIALVNGEAEALFGYARQELAGAPLELLVPERLREVHASHRARYVAAPRRWPMGEGRHLDARRKDGSKLPVEISLSPLETPQGLMVIAAVRDDAERRRGEQALRESRERLELALWASALGFWDWDLRTGEVFRDERWNRMLGYEPGQVPSTIAAWDALIHPDDQSHVLKELRAHLEGRAPLYRVEYRLRAGTGEWKWILDTGRIAVRDAQGRPLRVTGTHRDVSERKRLEQQLAETRDLLDALVRSAPIAIDLMDLDAKVRLWNPAAERIFGWTAEEVLGRRHPAVPEEALEEFREHFARVVRGETVTPMERPSRRKDGTPIAILVSAAPVHDATGRVVATVGTITDVTALKQTEAALLQAQKLDSLSALAGGVAHDFSNLLATILGRVSLALSKLPAGSQAQPHLEKAKAAVEQAGQLAAKMAACSGRSRFQVRRLSLPALIEESRPRLETAVPKQVRIVRKLAEPLPPIEADPGQIEQALVSLVLNAAEAIGERPGTICIETGTREVGVGDEELWWHTGQPLPPGSYVSLAVEDDGCGMDAPTLARAFEPFFSTRFVGRGLGLAAVLGIVRGHRGGIAVRSAPGRGSRFELVFPAVEPSEKGSSN